MKEHGWIRILRVMAWHGTLPGLTLGDIERKGNLPRGFATHQGLQYARRYGWNIPHVIDEGRHKYWMPLAERERARQFLSDRSEKAA